MLAVWFGATINCHAQPNLPHIGYVYPAGGRLGTTFQVVVGGQYLGAVSNAFFSGDGAQAWVIEYNRPLNQKEFNDMRDRWRALQDKRQAARRFSNSTNTWTIADEKEVAEIRARILKNPPNRQGNPAIAETVTLQVTLSTNAAPGEREIRLATPNGLSNPLIFHIGQLPEVSKPPAKTTSADIEKFLERLGKKPVPVRSEIRVSLPAIVNGQILPGAVDSYRFHAVKGQRLVFVASARALIPYLPDAVPGWFQATLTLYDSKGRELAYTDDFRFNPDPALYFEIPRDGDYVIEIRDAIYRGREDFVYRLAIGELPFVTGIFPLGGPAGRPTTVQFKGWNLGESSLTLEVKFDEPGVYGIETGTGEQLSNPTPFAVDTLPECLEQEPNNAPATAQQVTLPIIVNGRIDQPGDVDVFSLEGRAGAEIIAEVNARRLNSPLDSMLRLTDATGRQIAFNDDFEDKGAGLETHHADSYLRATLPTGGKFYVHLGDTQRKGGQEFAYRLRLGPPQPDFALRIVPSSLSLRPGASLPLTVYALRKDGFTNAITLRLKDTPEGFTLSGAQVPAGQDKVVFTVTAPVLPLARATEAPAPTARERDEVTALQLEGWAVVDGRVIFRPAVPAEDMMQAFAYHHLVPARELMVAISTRGPARPPLKIIGPTPVKIPAGGTARVQIGPAGRRFAENFRVELSEPPEGIIIQEVFPGNDRAEIELAADAAKVKPGLRGNLIVNIFGVRSSGAERGSKSAAARRVPVGTLPAIPFEIVACGR